MTLIDIKKLTFIDYPLKTYDKIRYSDTDRQGHVNNAVFSAFLETGRVEVLLHPEKPLSGLNGSFVIVNLNINLIAEIRWPGTIDIGTGIVKLGNSSIQMSQGLFQNEQLVATAETVIVHVDNETKRSSPLTQEAKNFLTQYLLKTEI